MSDELTVAGMSLAPGVVETIVSIAASEVEGIASIGSYASRSLLSRVAPRPSTAGIDIDDVGEGKLLVTLHVEVCYGSVFPELAAEVRSAVANALRNQVGVEVAAVDIYIDGIRFA